MISLHWWRSWKADPEVRPLADRHYNRHKVGSKQFAPPGRSLVLKHYDDAGAVDAFWITSWPLAQFTRHAWAGAWMCSAFRNEGSVLSSELIREAVSCTRWFFGRAPDQGFVTFVDEEKTRRKRDPGRCYRKAGFVEVGRTKDANLVALQLAPSVLRGPPGAYPTLMPAGATERHKDWRSDE